VLFGSLLALIYVWRIVETAYFQPISAELSGVREAPVGILVPMWVLVLLNIYFGIDSQFTVSLSELAAHSLYLEGR
jgi:multicomponent Na+:H+ antiporter subunit D